MTPSANETLKNTPPGDYVRVIVKDGKKIKNVPVGKDGVAYVFKTYDGVAKVTMRGSDATPYHLDIENPDEDIFK